MKWEGRHVGVNWGKGGEIKVVGKEKWEISDGE
jgi:hypothetical protein